MQKALLVSVLLLFCSNAMAAINCEGKVKVILDNNNYCSSIDPVSGATVPHLAYKLTSTNQSQWICSKNHRSDALIMGAFFSGQNLGVRVNSNTCSDLNGSYVAPQYLYVN